MSTLAAATAGDLLRAAAGQLRDAGIALPALEARLLVGHALSLPRQTLFAHPEHPVASAEADAVDGFVARRGRGEPLAYIVGEREFWSLPFAVSPDVLIPRPDTEAVVATALSHLDGVHRPLGILDLGTGSGCLLLALLCECPAATGIGVDRSEAALRLARRNARNLGFGARSAFLCADWGAPLDGSFDLIVCNPPYIDDGSYGRLEPTVRCFEPSSALRGGADGLDAYRALAAHLARLLGCDGLAVVEIGGGQGKQVAQLLAAAGLRAVGSGRDLSGRTRCLVARRA